MIQVVNSLWRAIAIVFLLLVMATVAFPKLKVTRIQLSAAGKPALVKGVVGGEAHDSYVLRLKKGQTLQVSIAISKSDSAAGNRAEFTVSETEFGEPVAFGSESEEGRVWSGTIPKTGDYFISVVAHPMAHYTLTVKRR
jgi:hypothetical protein